MYHIGDVLKVREWDDMAKEFGLDCDGDIKCNPNFLEEMKYMCGEKFTVASIKFGRLYDSEEGIEGELYTISDDMLEPLEEIPDFDAASEDELNSFLFS